MSGLDYHVLGLVPEGPFDLDAVIGALETEGYATARLVSAADLPGFRVECDDGWGIRAWLEVDDEARELSSRLADGPLPLGVRAEDVARRTGHLSIWSDDDDDLMNAHIFEEVIQLLKDRFGVLLWDDRLAEWR